MIGTIRKHSSWLWWIIAGLTIISFVVFMGSGPARNGNSRSASNPYGTLYGKEISADAFAQAQRGFYIYYWLRSGDWPGKSATFKREDIERETYIRLMLTQKAKGLGIHVSDDAVKNAAIELLRSVGRNGQAVPMEQFVEKVLQPEGLNVVDLQNFLRDDLSIQQLVHTLGLSGTLVTPQEAGQLYDRENQEYATAAVFFSASNYWAQATVTSAAIGQFYTNNMAAYREPDRVQVSYVAFAETNFVAQTKAEFAKTNFEDNVNSIYRQYGATEFADAKTPEEAKAKIRELLIHNRALSLAGQQAKEFTAALSAQESIKPETLAALAKHKGLQVRTTAPFAAQTGPEEFSAPAAFTKAAFKLGPDDTLAGPIAGSDALYVMVLAGKYPSSIPPLEQIRGRVALNCQQNQAIAIARAMGQSFATNVAAQLAAGKTFAQAAVAAGQVPTTLAPFSLSSQEVPEADGHAQIAQLKQTAFGTAPGKASSLVATADGGFVLFVQSLLPVDAAKKKTDLPDFTAQVRRARQNEAFNLWLQGEATHELVDTPVYAQMTGAKTPTK